MFGCKEYNQCDFSIDHLVCPSIVLLEEVTMQYCSLQHQTSITSHIYSWALFSLWLHLFILSGVISTISSSSILGTYWPGGFILQCLIFLPFHNLVLKARKLKGLPFTSLVDHILSELTMTRPFRVALHDVAYSFTEVDKAVIHVISLDISPSLIKLMSIESIMPSNHLILCRPLLLLPSIFLSITVSSNESALCVRWPQYWSYSSFLKLS